jgi:hypothetical protein
MHSFDQTPKLYCILKTIKGVQVWKVPVFETKSKHTRYYIPFHSFTFLVSSVFKISLLKIYLSF